MIQLYEFPYSPFAIVQRRLMDFGGIPFKSIKVSNADRSAIWKLTKGEYYQIPVLKDGRKVIFESGDFTQDIATHSLLAALTRFTALFPCGSRFIPCSARVRVLEGEARRAL